MKEKILFLISKGIGLSLLESFKRANDSNYDITVMTLNDSDDPRSHLLEIQNYCRDKNLTLKVVSNNKEFQSHLGSIEFTSIFVCGWYWLIPESIISRANGNVFGIHHSLLPKYRGFSPLVWSLIAGDKTVGSTLFKINNKLDEGEVFFQWKTEPNGRPIRDVLEDLESKIVTNFGDVLLEVIHRKNLGIRQDNNKATYCARRTPKSGHINWSYPAEYILNFINAQSEPYPGAFFYIDDNKHIIDSADLFEYPVLGVPGQIIMHIDSGVVICAGNSKGLVIRKIKGINNLKKVFNSLDIILE